MLHEMDILLSLQVQSKCSSHTVHCRSPT